MLQDVEILVSYERTMHLCMLPAKKSPFRCLADLLRLCLQKKSTPKMAPDLVQGGFFSHLSSQDARKEYLWKESGEEARWKQSLWDSIHVMDSSGEIANERACGFLNAGCEAKCECSARMLGEISWQDARFERTHPLMCCDICNMYISNWTTDNAIIDHR